MLVHTAEATDRQRGAALVERQQLGLTRLRDHGGEVLAATRQPDAAARLEFDVERGVGEVGLEQRLGDLGGQPGEVERQGVLAGHAQTFQVHQRRIGGQFQRLRHGRIAPDVKNAHDTVLRDAGGLDRREQAVQRAQGLFDDWDVGEPGGSPPLGDQHPGVPQMAQRFTYRVPAHAVARRQGVLAGESLGELPGLDARQQIGVHLRPQRQGTVAVDMRRQVIVRDHHDLLATISPSIVTRTSALPPVTR